MITSGECLQMSLRPDAAILFKESSGSWIHKTNNGTAPASTTACDSSEKEAKISMKILWIMQYF